MINKKIAQVEFEIVDVESEIKDIIEILHSNDEGAVEEIFFLYPMLLRRLKKSSSDPESNKIIAKFFRAAAKDNKNKAIKYKQVFKRIWNIVNDDFMSIISKIMNVKISEDEVFTGLISLITIKKRDLENNTFKIFIRTKTRESKDLIFYEVAHLLFDKKFKSLFGDTKDNELKNHFTEIVLKSVLMDSKIQRISIYKPKISEQYENIIIGENFLLNIIEKMYEEKKDFDSFLKDAWEFVKKNKKSIDEQFEASVLE